MTTTKKVSVTGTSAASLLNSGSFSGFNVSWVEAASAGANTFIVNKATSIANLSLRGTGDALKIDGYSGDFSASISGSKLTLIGTSANNTQQKIVVALAKASTLKLSFTDGDQSLSYSTAGAKLVNGTHTTTLTKVALPVYGVTAHEASAVVAALTDAAGNPYATLADAIKSDNAAAIDKAISTATGGAITKLADLATAYTPTFSVVAGASASEGTDASFTVNLSVAQAVATSVSFGLTGVAGAVADSDFNTTPTVSGTGVTLSGTTLTFAPGVTTATLKFPTLTDNVTPEAGEGVALSLTAVASSIAKVNASASTDKVLISDVPRTLTTVDSTSDAHTLTATPNVPDTYDIKAGAYGVTIDGFSTGDHLNFFAGATLNVVRDTDQTDNIQQITATDANGNTTTITLKNLTATQDAGLNNVGSFTNQFGADTISIAGVSQTPVVKAITSATTGTVNATTGLDVFNIASGAYDVTINGFAPGDNLNFFAGATLNVVRDTNQADKTQQITATDSNGIVTTITLTGLTDAQDQGLFTTTSFANQFGAGTLTFA